jgi:hypothetical protein
MELGGAAIAGLQIKTKDKWPERRRVQKEVVGRG